jgi:hypothetical protein
MPPALAFQLAVSQWTGSPYSGTGLVPAAALLLILLPDLLPDSPAADTAGFGRGDTLHVHTAGSGRRDTLHVHAAGFRRGDTLQAHTAGGGRGYTLHIHAAGFRRG